MKCDDCPLKSDEFDYMESGIKMTVCPYWHEDCHLTPANQRIIEAMLAGEFNCANCRHFASCALRSAPYYLRFCDDRQLRKADGE